ncbi:GTP cyclohydrolase I FolE [Haemophilus influenzae]|uniref:GTP cyclohydrolase I FolE n=1 Tax=Haemophilus influenzae TaxID=727 RepID=UPI0034DA89FD
MSKISLDALNVRNALIEKGIETPMIDPTQAKNERRENIAKHMNEVMKLIGLDLRDDSLEETPNRLAKIFIDEIFSGMDYANFPKMTKIKNQMKVSEMVQVNDITLTSTCEHHFVTIDGKVCVAYYPKDWVIGLSKINRIVSFFAQRPQVQERLTEQLLTAFQTILETDDVAVYVKATHFCVKARGIRDTNSYTVTSAYGGVFLEDRDTRKEFLATVQK